MFVASDSKSAISIEGLAPPPVEVRTYLLEDERDVLAGYVWEYDVIYREVPADLQRVIRQCLQAAQSAGAHVAWFAFEGSFHFDHLLTKEIANQVYAVCDEEGVSIASDDELDSKQWQTRIVRAGARLVRNTATRE